MTLHAALDVIRDSFFVVVFGQFGLIMAIEAGEAARARWMAGGTHAVCTVVINRKGVVETGSLPTRSVVTVRALPGKMIGRPPVEVTTLTVSRTRRLVIEGRTSPGRGIMTGGTLTTIVIGWTPIEVTALAVGSPCCLMIEDCASPGCGVVAS